MKSKVKCLFIPLFNPLLLSALKAKPSLLNQKRFHCCFCSRVDYISPFSYFVDVGFHVFFKFLMKLKLICLHIHLFHSLLLLTSAVGQPNLVCSIRKGFSFSCEVVIVFNIFWPLHIFVDVGSKFFGNNKASRRPRGINKGKRFSILCWQTNRIRGQQCWSRLF